MGWGEGYVGGRHVGYNVPATCDARGCGASIDRGLGYRCGGANNLHDDGYGCGRYFCEEHLKGVGARGGCSHRQRRAWGVEEA